MRILAFDTAFEACSAAIIEDGRTLWRAFEIIGRGHAEILPIMVAGGLKKAGLEMRDFDRVGVVTGPGAFAGVRVGVAFARGLALATRLEAVGVSSLAALAASAPMTGAKVAPVFDARRGQVYAGLYAGDLQELVKPFAASPEEAAGRIPGDAALTGPGASLVAQFLPAARIDETHHIDPVAVGRLAASATPPSAMPSPLYLRPPDAAPGKASAFQELFGR